MPNDTDVMGSPEEFLPPEDLAKLPPSWETVAPKIQQAYPGADLEELKQHYHKQRQLAIARTVAASKPLEGTFHWLARQGTPLVSGLGAAIEQVGYGRAKQRLEGGQPEPGDYRKIAEQEEQEKRDAQYQSTLGGTIATGFAKVPAIVGEAALGGAALKGLGAAATTGAKVTVPWYSASALGKGVARNAATTAFMPSIWAEQFVRGNVAAKRDPTDPRGFPAAYGLGMLQNAMLGGAAKLGSKAGGGIAGRVGASAGLGVAGQAVADVASSALADVLPYAEAMQTRYGTLGAMYRGEFGEAGRHAAAQAILFGAFGALHGKEPKAAMQEAAKALDDGAKQGLSASAAAERMMGPLLSERDQARPAPPMPAVPEGTTWQARQAQRRKGTPGPLDEGPGKIPELRPEENQKAVEAAGFRNDLSDEDRAALGLVPPPGSPTGPVPVAGHSPAELIDAWRARQRRLEDAWRAQEQPLRKKPPPETPPEGGPERLPPAGPAGPGGEPGLPPPGPGAPAAHEHWGGPKPLGPEGPGGEPGLPPPQPGEQPAFPLRPTQKPPTAAEARAQDVAEVQKRLMKLTAGDRAVVQMLADGKSFAEVGEELGKTGSAAEQQAKKIAKALGIDEGSLSSVLKGRGKPGQGAAQESVAGQGVGTQKSAMPLPTADRETLDARQKEYTAARAAVEKFGANPDKIQQKVEAIPTRAKLKQLYPGENAVDRFARSAWEFLFGEESESGAVDLDRLGEVARRAWEWLGGKKNGRKSTYADEQLLFLDETSAYPVHGTDFADRRAKYQSPGWYQQPGRTSYEFLMNSDEPASGGYTGIPYDRRAWAEPSEGRLFLANGSVERFTPGKKLKADQRLLDVMMQIEERIAQEDREQGVPEINNRIGWDEAVHQLNMKLGGGEPRSANEAWRAGFWPGAVAKFLREQSGAVDLDVLAERFEQVREYVKRTGLKLLGHVSEEKIESLGELARDAEHNPKLWEKLKDPAFDLRGYARKKVQELRKVRSVTVPDEKAWFKALEGKDEPDVAMKPVSKESVDYPPDAGDLIYLKNKDGQVIQIAKIAAVKDLGKEWQYVIRPRAGKEHTPEERHAYGSGYETVSGLPEHLERRGGLYQKLHQLGVEDRENLRPIATSSKAMQQEAVGAFGEDSLARDWRARFLDPAQPNVADEYVNGPLSRATGEEALKFHGPLSRGLARMYRPLPRAIAEVARQRWFERLQNEPGATKEDFQQVVNDVVKEYFPDRKIKTLAEGIGRLIGEGSPEADPLREAFREPYVSSKFLDMLNEAAKKFLREEHGFADLDKIGEWVSKTAGSLWRSGEARGKEWLAQMRNLGTHVANAVRKLAGEIAPQTTRISRKVGEALGLVHAADEFVARAVPFYVGEIMGKRATEEQAFVWGEALHEKRQREAADRKQQEAAKAKQAGNADRAEKLSQEARDVERSIGKPWSRIQTEAEYQKIVDSPEFKAMEDRWEKHLTPKLDEWYKLAEGMDLADPIENLTQLKKTPFHAKRYAEGDPLPEGGTFTSGRGRLQNLKQQRISAAHPATLSGERYVTDLREMIKNSIQDRYKTAMKANALRSAVQEGYGRFGPPGTKGEIKGHKEVELPFVSPPKGTQEAVPGVPAKFKDRSFYAAEPLYQDFRDAWGVDQPMKAIPGTGVFNLAALASSAEAVYHSKNLLTMLMKPGMLNPGRLWGNLVGRMQQSPETMAKLLEIARIGAAKPEAKRPGLLWGGTTDPTAWMGKGLEVLGDVVRLTAHDAFDEMAKAGLTPDTITNRRNFINQTGQYLKTAQPKLVQFLRDTQLGPFATAGTNYWMQGLRALTGNPGVEPTSVSAALKLRAWTYGKMAAVIGTGFAFNYLLHQNVLGDDKTPFGAIKAYDDKGHTVYFDLVTFTGLTRGLRQTGLLATLEGKRAERPGGKIIDRASEDVAHNLLHPLMGPPVQFLHTALTGKNSIGMDIAPKAPVGGSQQAQNVGTALANANPVLGALTQSDRPPNASEGTLSRGVKLLGPYGFKEKVREPVVGTYYDRLRDLEEHRRASPERRAGKVFPQEREYRVLERFREQMDRLNHAIKGERQVNGRTIQGPKPDGPTEARLRQLQAQLAQRALQAAGQ